MFGNKVKNNDFNSFVNELYIKKFIEFNEKNGF